MGSMSGLYVRCGDEGDLLARVRADHPGAVIEAPSAFASIPLHAGDDPGEAALRDLSSRYRTEVIFLLFVSVTDSFAFTHCADGRCLRHLRYGCDKEERWWEVVEGEPEAWERAVFFDDEQQVHDIDDDDPDKPDVEELFRLGRVRAGVGWPILDAREAARAVAVHFRLTDWLDDWAEPAEIARRNELAAATRTGATPGANSEAPAATLERPALAPPAERAEQAPNRPWWRFW